MDTVALLITRENCTDYRTELNHALNVPNGYDPSYWIGYYLVIGPEGPKVMSPTKFAATYVFAIDPSKPIPVYPR